MDEDEIRDSCELVTRMGLDFQGLEVASLAGSQESHVTSNLRSEEDQEMEIESFMNLDQLMEDIEEPPSKRSKTDDSDSNIDEGGESDSETTPPFIQEQGEDMKLRGWKRCKICPHCNSRVDSNNYIRHIEEKHQVLRKFSCVFCQKNYNRKEDLDKHLCPK